MWCPSLIWTNNWSGKMNWKIFLNRNKLCRIKIKKHIKVLIPKDNFSKQPQTQSFFGCIAIKHCPLLAMLFRSEMLIQHLNYIRLWKTSRSIALSNSRGTINELKDSVASSCSTKVQFNWEAAFKIFTKILIFFQ